MTDDRDFNEWAEAHGVRKPQAKNITFLDYLRNVLADSSRAEERDILIKLFGFDTIDAVLEGKTLIEARDFSRPKKINKTSLQTENMELTKSSASDPKKTIFGTPVP